MNNKSMAYDEAYFMAKYYQADFEEDAIMNGYYINWNYLVEQNFTREDQVLELTLSYLKELFLLSEYALDNGITLTDNEKKAIASEVDSFMSNSHSKLISSANANEELMSRIYTRRALYNKICDQILIDKDLSIDPEDARICTIKVATITAEKFDSPERVANEIANRVNNGDVLGEVAGYYGLSIEKSYIGKDSEGKKEAIDFCLSLKSDECKVLELDGNYLVIYCVLENDEVETANNKENLLTEKKQSYITAFIDELLKENPITINTTAWETINFDTRIYVKDDIIKSE